MSPNATSLTLRPGAWAPSAAACPVSHLAVEYRARDATAGSWLVASRALQPREGPMTLHHLRPDTWYSLRVTADTEAGPAVAEYSVRTLPASTTLAGEPQRNFVLSALVLSVYGSTLYFERIGQLQETVPEQCVREDFVYFLPYCVLNSETLGLPPPAGYYPHGWRRRRHRKMKTYSFKPSSKFCRPSNGRHPLPSRLTGWREAKLPAVGMRLFSHSCEIKVYSSSERS